MRPVLPDPPDEARPAPPLLALAPVTVNSTALYALAFILQMSLHETGHALAGRAMGLHTVIHHGSARHTDLFDPSQNQILAMMAGGPLTSLALGLSAIPLFRALGRTTPLLRLFVAWLAFHGLTAFFGYLVSTPFAPGADLTNIADLLGWPLLARWVAAAFGLAGVMASGHVLEALLVTLAPQPILTTRVGRIRLALAAAVFPWLIAALPLVAATWPPSHWLQVVYVAGAGLPALNALGAAKDHHRARGSERALETRVSLGALLALALGVTGYRVFLVPGIDLGGR